MKKMVIYRETAMDFKTGGLSFNHNHPIFMSLLLNHPGYSEVNLCEV